MEGSVSKQQSEGETEKRRLSNGGRGKKENKSLIIYLQVDL